LKVDKSGGNELEFIDFLESNSKVKWWHKQGDHGKEFFSIIYREQDEIEKTRFVNALFYPDWIICTKDDEIWIVDTKKGMTGVERSSNTIAKMKALNDWLRKNKKYKGGIVEPYKNDWYLIKSIDSEGKVDRQKIEF
jgi:hypothetical protein